MFESLTSNDPFSLSQRNRSLDHIPDFSAGLSVKPTQKLLGSHVSLNLSKAPKKR